MDPQIQTALEKQNPWWFKKEYDTGAERLKNYPKILKFIETPEILMILGVRRGGKSTLLYQIIHHLNVQPEAVLFINMDEPLFQSKSKDAAFLSTLIEEYMLQHKTIKKFFIFIDEVQNYDYWVQTIKTLHDVNKTIKFILTGSTSTILKKYHHYKIIRQIFLYNNLPTLIYRVSFV